MGSPIQGLVKKDIATNQAKAEGLLINIRPLLGNHDEQVRIGIFLKGNPAITNTSLDLYSKSLTDAKKRPESEIGSLPTTEAIDEEARLLKDVYTTFYKKV